MAWRRHTSIQTKSTKQHRCQFDSATRICIKCGAGYETTSAPTQKSKAGQKESTPLVPKTERQIAAAMHDGLIQLMACFDETGELNEQYQDQLSVAWEACEKALLEYRERNAQLPRPAKIINEGTKSLSKLLRV